MTQILMRTLKHRAVRLTAASLLLFGLTFFFAFASTALAWDDCPFGEVDCVYPGDCSRYVDTNGDGICDRSQPEPTTAAAEATETVVANVDETVTGTADTGMAADASTDTDTASGEVVAATGDEDGGGGRRRGEETTTDGVEQTSPTTIPTNGGADASTSDTDTGDAAVAAIGESGTGGNGG
ncbi:MAG: hypothetical protein JW990_04135, partial [Thermoleophilia bacterium]|nr:hypothetical protein [Thermoleophilia bacterium]